MVKIAFSMENALFGERRTESHFRCCKNRFFDADFPFFVTIFEILMQKSKNRCKFLIFGASIFLG